MPEIYFVNENKKINESETEKYLNNNISRKNLEQRIIKGNLIKLNEAN